MRKLYIARHGETDYNVQNRYAGTIDVPLNQKGIEQSKKLAKTLTKYPIDIIVSSSKKRAIETAEIIEKYLGKPLVKKDAFVERNLGIYEGLTRNEAREKYPDLWARNVLHEKNNAEHGGESVGEVIKRVKKALEEALLEYEGQTILIITHGYVSRMLHGLFLGISEEENNDFLLSNCQVAEYDIE